MDLIAPPLTPGKDIVQCSRDTFIDLFSCVGESTYRKTVCTSSDRSSIVLWYITRFSSGTYSSARYSNLLISHSLYFSFCSDLSPDRADSKAQATGRLAENA